ncbi:MAG: hypothetical protein MUP45_01210 [Candidatus Marinimicrobia bacterium]|nr:hypothetical protein [Candidatus Neomarinimicrobiota bacterium]
MISLVTGILVFILTALISVRLKRPRRSGKATDIVIDWYFALLYPWAFGVGVWFILFLIEYS